MAAVVKVFSTSLVAVPALSRVDPASTSGPVIGRIRTSASTLPGQLGLQLIRTVPAPRRRAASSAARANGVTPLAEMPTTTSPRRTRARTARRAAASSSSAPSRERKTAPRPPAMIACTS